MCESGARRLGARGGLLRVARRADFAGERVRFALDFGEARAVLLELVAEVFVEGAPLFGEVLALLVKYRAEAAAARALAHLLVALDGGAQDGERGAQLAGDRKSVV